VPVGSFGGSTTSITASGQAIAVNAAGDGIYITGLFTGSTNLIVGGSTLAGQGANAVAFVIKLNGQGVPQWVKG
jgi:hypothetical protein